MRAEEAVRVGALHGDGVLIVHHVFRPDSSLQILEVGEMLPLMRPRSARLSCLPAERDAEDLLGSGPAAS